MEKMDNLCKRILSLVVAAVMVLGMVPTNVFTTRVSATEVTENSTAVTVTTEAELQNALTNGGEVVLGADILVNETIEIPAGVTAELDLAGYAITSGLQSDTTKHIYAFRNNGKLTIEDSSDEKTGSITGRGIYNGTSGEKNTGVELTINGAKIVAQDWNGGAGVWGYGADSKVYLNDATIIGNTGVVSSEGYLEINGGTYTCYSGIDDEGTQLTSPTYNIRAYNGLKITDGTFTSRHGVISLGGGEGVIEDGSYTIVFKAATTSNVVYMSGNAKLTIDGGEFLSDDTADIADSGAAVLVSGSDAKLTINDGTFVGMNGMVSVNENTVINGGSFDTVFGYNHYGSIESAVAEGATITVADTVYTKTENGLEEVTYVAMIGTKGYNTLADAVADAEDGDTITLLNTTIDANVSISGGKNLTFTGEATFDWSKGFFFIGRNVAGADRDVLTTVTFKDATIHSLVKKNPASYGFHVSGYDKTSDKTNYGALVIENSTIEVDYLINRNSVTVTDSDLTVYGGFAVHGRNAEESKSGENETATFTASDSNITIVNENGMGLGVEGYGKLDVTGGSFTVSGSSFNVRQADDVANFTNTEVSVPKGIANAGTITVTGGQLTDTKISGAGTTNFSGQVDFHGTNEVLSGVNGSDFELVVNKGATLLISRFVLGYNRNITVYGEIEDAHAFDPNGKTPSLKFNSTSGVSVGGTGTGNLTVKDAYVELGNSSWKNAYGTYDWTFENSYVSATSFTNNNAAGADSATWNVTFDDSVLAAKNYIKNGTGTTYNFTNGSVATTGSLRIDGVLNIDETSSVTTTAQQNNVVGAEDEHGGINGTVNVAGELTIGSTAKTQLEVLGGELNIEGGTVNLSGNTLTLDADSTLTIDVTGMSVGEEYTGIKGAVVNNGDIVVKGNNSIQAEINENGNVVLAERKLSGTGTAEDPYLINNLDDLKFFRDNVNAGDKFQGKTIKLTANIDLDNEPWTPIANFNGIFDGQNHTIYNLVVNGGSSSNQGFFGTTQNGEIKNLVFENAKVTGRLNVGVVAGQPYTSKYTNIKVTGHVEVNGMAYVGGVGGKNAYANWTDVTVDVDSTSYVKAISTEDGTAYRTYVGGVVGFNGEGGHTFKNISSNIKVIGDVCDIGGLFGIAHYGNKFENVTFTGSVEAPEGAFQVGGIAGVWHNEKGQTVTFTNVTSTGTVTVGNETTTGSIVGGAYNASNSTPDNSGSLIIDGKEAWICVAMIGENRYATVQDAIDAAQNGDEVVILVAGTYKVPSGKNITVTGAVDGVVFDNIGAHNMGGASVTFTNVTFNYDADSHYKGLQHSGDLVYNNCTFNGQVFLYGTSETFNNCTFNQTNAEYYNVWTYGAKEVAFNNCTFNCVGKAVLIYSEDKAMFNDVTVADCDFIASAPVDGKAAIEMDSSSTAGIKLTIDDKTTVTGFGFGNVSGNSLWNNKKGNDTDANNDITVVVDGDTVLAPVTFVAQIGEKKYADLHEAMVACKAGETVLLIAHVNLAGTEWEPVSFKGTFDGQGYTISNLTINKPGVSNVGFITSLNGTFKNVTFTNPTVTGGECTGVVAGRAGGSAALAENITVNGTIKVETTHSGYARAGVIVGGWAYGNYKNITVDGGDKTVSYIKHTGGGDGRYVAGIVGHADDVDSYVNCTVKNITISGGWLCGGIAGPGPSDGLASGCVVENVDMGADYSGGMFGWYFGSGTIKDSSVKNVTFTDGTTNNGAIGGYGTNDSATVTNVTIENVTNGDKPLLEHVAEVNGVYYMSLQAAIEAVEDGGSVKLLRNVTVTEAAYGQNALNHARAVSFTLDLNGYTLSADTGNSVLRFNLNDSGATSDVTITIKNGTIVSGANTWTTVMASGIDGAKAVMNLEDMTIENSKGGDFAVKAWANGVVNAKNVTINASYGGGFYALGGEITLDDCTVNQEGLWTAPYLSMTIGVSNGGKMTVNSGTYTAVPAAAADGNNQGTSHGSWCGGIMSSGGTLIINGGTFTNGNIDGTASYPRELLIIGADADYGNNVAAELIINGGTFNSIGDLIHCETIWGSETDPANTYMPTMDIAITGGDFTGVAGKVIGGCDPISTGNPVGVEISGGTYNANNAIDDSYLAEGCELKVSGGKYVVEATPVAVVGGTIYNNLQAAINAANGKTVYLQRNATTAQLTIPEGYVVTLDMQGKTLNGSILAPNAELTILNGSIVNPDKGTSALEINAGKLTLTNVNMDSARHALRIDGAVEATIDGGTYRGAIGTGTGTYHALNVSGAAKVTIKAGTFVGPKGTTADSGAAVNVQSGATVAIEGGSFSGGKNNTLAAKGNLTVTGGTYDQNPKAFLAYGYCAVYADGTYTVTEAEAYVNDDGYPTIDEAMAAAVPGDTVTILAGDYYQNLNVNKDITVIGETADNGYQLVAIYGKLNITADGATVKGLYVYNDDNAAYIGAKDVLIEGCEIASGSSAFRYCYTEGTVTFKDSVIAGSVYGIHFDGSDGGNIVIDGCKIQGWTSFASTITKVTISDTEFAEGNYNQLRFYQDVEMTNVVFNPEMTIDFGTEEVSAVFNNCSVSDGSNLLDVIYLPDQAQMGIDITVDGEPVVVVAMIDDVCYLDIDKAFEAVKSGDTMTVYADCTLTKEVKLDGMTLTIDGTAKLDVENLVTVSGETTLNITAPMTDLNGNNTCEIKLAHGTILTNCNVSGDAMLYGKVTFRGSNSFAMLYDYGNAYSDEYAEWIVEKGATLTLNTKARYGLGYGDKVTITGELVDALTARTNKDNIPISFFTHGLVAMSNWDVENSMTVKDAYVVIGSNNSFGNSHKHTGSYTFDFTNVLMDGSRITFYEAASVTTFNFTNSDVEIGTFMTRDANSVFTLTNTKLVSTTTFNGNDEGNYHAGKLVLTNSALTYSAPLVMENGTIEMDLSSTITAPSITGTGKIVIDATNFNGSVKLIKADMSGFTGTIEVIGAVYSVDENGLTIRAAAAKIGDDYYKSLAAAIEAVQNGETIVLLNECAESVTIKQTADLSFTIDGGDNTFTGTITIDGNKRSSGTETLTIQNINFVAANDQKSITTVKNSFAHNITIEDCTFTGDDAKAAYGIHLQHVYNITLKNVTGTKLYDLVYGQYAVTGLVAENITVTESGMGFWLPYGKNLTFKNMTVSTESSAVGIRNYNASSVVFENCNLSATDGAPVVLQQKTANAYALTFNGTNTFTSGTEYWVDVQGSGANIKVTLNDTGMDAAKVSNMVANIGNVHYNSLQYAIADAENDATVTLYKDLTLDTKNTVTISDGYAAIFAVTGKAVTVNLNGKTITVNAAAEDLTEATDEMLVAVFAVDTDGDLTLTGNGSVEAYANDAKIYSLLTAYQDNSKITVESGSYKLDAAHDSLIFSCGSDTVTINDGNFHLGNVGTGTNGKPWIFNALGANERHINVNGGTFNADINHEFWAHEVNVPETSSVKNNGDGTWTVVPAVAYIIENAHGYDRKVGYATLADAFAAAFEGATITLLKDVELSAPITVKESITLNGNSHKITQTAECNNQIALLYFEGADGALLDVTVKNVTFDGIQTGAAIRTLNANMTIDNCVFQNCNHTTVGQGLVRLTKGCATVKNSKFLNNNCPMGISFNWDTAGNADDTLLVENCVFEGNTANKTALIYYVKGVGCTLKDNKFIGNTVNCADNGAVVYLGFTEDNVVTGNLFQDNVVKEANSSTRVAGAIFFGYEAEIYDNAFINNTASNANGDVLGQVCTSTYYECTIDLSKNYWGGEEPVYGKDYTIQHQTGDAEFVMNSYYAKYDSTTGELSELVNTAYVAQIGKVFYTTIADAIKAAKAGETVTILAGDYTTDISVNKAITVVGETDENGNNLVNITGRVSVSTGATVKNLNVHNEKTGDYDCALAVSGKDIVIDGVKLTGYNGMKYCYATGDVTIKNSTINGSDFAVHFDGSNGGNVLIENCDITGWVSYGGGMDLVTLKDSTFKKGDWAGQRSYADAVVIEGSTFEAGYKLDIAVTGSTVTVTDSEMADGSSIIALFNSDDACGQNNITIDGDPLAYVAAIGSAYYESLEEALANVADWTTIKLVADATLDYNAREAYGRDSTTDIIIDGQGFTLTLNQKDSNWSSIGMANPDGKLTLKNMTIEKTGYGDTSGTWNTHAIQFTCNVEMSNVTINNAIAVENGATLDNVTINEANGYYGLWITGNGQTVTVNGGEINATNGGRGIKIADEYVGEAVAQVTLTVDGMKFNTAKKAAVLVSSTAGAKVTATNCDITNVAEDSVNFVWVDEDWAAYYGNVTVNDEAAAQENLESFTASATSNGVFGYYATITEAVAAADTNTVVTLLADSDEDVTIKQVEGQNIILDGADFEFTGTIYIHGNARYDGAETLTIQNFMFATTEAEHDFISSNTTASAERYAHNVTVKDCEFVATGDAKESAVGLRFRQAYNINVVNCDAYGLHSVMWATGGSNFTVDNLDANNCKNGLSFGTTTPVTVKNSEINAEGYGIRMDGNAATALTVENCEIEAEMPIIVRKATTEGVEVNLTGNNSLTATGDSYQVIITAGDDDEAFVAPSVDFVLEGAKDLAVFPEFVASVNGEGYLSLAKAIEAANGQTVIVLNDIILDAPITVAADMTVTLDLNGHTVSYATTESKGESMITNKGNLTIIDSVGEGKLSYEYKGAADTSYGYGNQTIENYGTLTLESGTVENTTVAMSHASYAINTREGATLNVKGGKVLNLNGHAIRQTSFGTAANTVNISGGYIEGTRALQFQLPGSASATAPEMTLNITGGELNSNESTYNLAVYVYSNGQSAEKVNINIEGGVFNGNVAINGAATASMAAKAVSVTGGTFNGDYGVFSYADADTNNAISITGGTYATNYSESYATDDGYQFVANENGTFSVEEKPAAPTDETTINDSMQANLTLKNKVILNICFTLGNTTGAPEEYLDRVGLLVWDASNVPADATIENCDRVYNGEAVVWDAVNSRYEAHVDDIPAKNMGDAITFRVYYQREDGTIVYGRMIENYSPKTYCYNKLNPAKDSDTSDDALMIAILNYGAAAQVFFNHRTNELMNSDLTAEQQALVWDGSLVRSDWSIPAEKEGSLSRTPNAFTGRGANLTLLGAIDYNFYVVVAEDIEVKEAKMLVWDEAAYNAATVLSAENATAFELMDNVYGTRYEYTVEGMPAKDMFSPVYACAVITDVDGNVYYSGVVAYCPERYGYINQNSTDAATAELAKRIVIYGDAARNYFGN